MRNLMLSSLATLAVLVPPLAWADPPAEQPLVRPDQAGQSSAAVAAATPMHDMGLMRQTIPPLLMTVMDDPYARPASMNCRALGSQVGALNAALGDDYDVADTPDESREARRARTARAGLHAGSGALLPFAGVIRTLSGAEKHDRLVLDAVMAGQARRAYLKGLGEARGCGGIARPLHVARASDRREDAQR